MSLDFDVPLVHDAVSKVMERRSFCGSTGRWHIKSSQMVHRLPFFYGWIIVLLGFVVLFASFGIRASFGSYITSWENEFHIGRTLVTSISFLSFITLAIAQPLIGKLNDRFGARIVLTLSMLLVGVSLFLCA